MRPWTEGVYGIPPEQVVGSSIKTKYEVRGGKPVLMRLPALNFIDDKAGKPVGINSHIGRRPIAAFGNSDGDRQMLEWTHGGGGARLMMLVHHDDAAREWAYGPKVEHRHLQRFADGRSQEAGLERHQHEGRLESRVRRPLSARVLRHRGAVGTRAVSCGFRDEAHAPCLDRSAQRGWTIPTRSLGHCCCRRYVRAGRWPGCVVRPASPVQAADRPSANG